MDAKNHLVEVTVASLDGVAGGRDYGEGVHLINANPDTRGAWDRIAHRLWGGGRPPPTADMRCSFSRSSMARNPRGGVVGVRDEAIVRMKDCLMENGQ